ncbi:hypothetical protein DDB_G0283409 [Dictyostelium discoideum AX4]|uniref:Uncharacterized protein n=1 Tax=Dictyostelium discoideum TaxID=44689 RepID=Q54R48_DICDI|nr:hypothetical protein DDB_G0283409 [Dictyostelium discoideum AX4]EAL65689.1 hypothetical protein DDB_G0283409 [Dictyostelium discoideum AX4]|eukprot:XP_639043.1 hypothetical protein DDB_G0283409 [Dictyostelium discoideum AX4]
MRFKSHESNKYLQESWDKANHDNKIDLLSYIKMIIILLTSEKLYNLETVVLIEEKTAQPNLTSGKISILKELKPQYDELKQEQIKSSKQPQQPQEQSKETKQSSSSTPTTTTTLGSLIPNTAKPWQKI